MYIKQLRFKNCGPYGNILYTFDFDNKEDVGQLWQILGKNGVGKSFFLKIIKIGLYLETDGMLMSEISNDINGDGYIDITYDSNGDTWRNESIYGQSKLKTLSIYKNGNEKPEDFGGIGETKKHLVEHILDMPYYIFNNAISLSVNDFKSFLSMDAKDTRNIRDRIFGFYIVNEMVEIIRKTLNKYTTQQEEILNSLIALGENIDSTNKTYEEAKLKNEKNDKDSLDELNGELVEYQEKYDTTKQKIECENKKLDDWQLVYDKIYDDICKEEIRLLEEKKVNVEKSITNINTDVNNKSVELELLNSEKKILLLKLAKAKIDVAKNDINNVKVKLDNLKKSEELAKIGVDEMETSIKNMEDNNNNAAIVSNLINEINNLYSVQTMHDNYIKKKLEYANTEITISTKKKEVNDKINELTNERTQLTERKELIESGKCDRCHTDLTTNTFIEENSKIIERINEINVALDGRNKVMKKILESEKQLSEAKVKVDKLITDYSSNISSSITSLNHLVPDNNDKFIKMREFIKRIKKEEFINVESFKELATECSFVNYDDDKINEATKKLEELKSEYKKINDEYSDTNTDYISKDSSIKTLEEQLQDVDEKELEKELKLNDESEYDSKIGDINKVVKTKGEELISYNKQLASTETEIAAKQKELKNAIYFKEINVSYVAEISQTETPTEYITAKVGVINTDIGVLETELNELNENVIATNTSINNINKDKEDVQLESIKKIIDEFVVKQNEQNIKNEELQKKINFVKILDYVLSDECVKAYMLREIVPTINNEIANMLMALGVNLTVVFNDEFKPTIYRFGNKASLGSISTGQKKMIDEAILMSITILIYMRYGKFNLVSYDEIFSSLHVTMIPIMLELIKEKLCKKLKLTVILINHSYMSSSYFDKIGYIYHKDNFSFMDVMTPDEYEKLEFEEIANTDAEIKELENK